MAEETATTQIKLPAVLDATAAAGLKSALLAGLGSGQALEVDASDVQRVTTPCLQILVAAAIDAAEKGGLQFVGVEGVMLESIRALGLSEALGMVS